jgi:hypothetical protein
MSKFLTPLEIELIEDGVSEYRGLWRVKSPLVYQSDVAGKTITVPAGFITDLESCPRLPGVFLLFGEIAHAAAVCHDFLYTAPVIVDRETADAVLYEACLLSGIPKWRAYGIWAGVRIGGGSHFGEKPK